MTKNPIKRKRKCSDQHQKKWTVMNPIWRRMKKRSPSSGQNSQLVHRWLLVHSGRFEERLQGIV